MKSGEKHERSFLITFCICIYFYDSTNLDYITSTEITEYINSISIMAAPNTYKYVLHQDI